MTKEQEILLEMVKEIHYLCEANNIEYFLSNRMALAAFQDGEFDQGYWYTGQILMTSENLEAFINAFNSLPRKDREIEWMGNSEKFPGPCLRYINSETLCYTPVRFAVENSIGMYITIELLRYANKKERPYYEPIESAWRDICFGIKRRNGIKLFLAKSLLRFFCIIFGRKKVASKLNSFFFRKCQSTKGKKIVYIKNSISEIKEYYEPKMFINCKDAYLAGQKVLVPTQLEKYIKKKYGSQNYKRVGENIKPRKESFICDPEISYKVVDLKDSKKTVRKIFAFEQERLWRSRLERKEKEECFSLMVRTFYRYYYGKKLLPRKDELRNLLDADAPQLYDDDFWDYRLEFNRLIKKNLNLYIDEDIKELLVKWLTQEGKLKQAKKVSKNLDNILTSGLPVYDYDGNYITDLRDEYEC